MSIKVNAMNEKRDKQWDRLDSIISREFSVSHMSNSKWVKLLKSACLMYPDIHNFNYKLVYSDEIKNSVIEQYEEHIDNYWFIEPSIYKEVEWIEFLSNNNSKLNEFKSELSKLGKFNIHKSLTGLRIYGYTRHNKTN